MKTLLFVYGRLMHDYDPPKSMVSWTRDAVRGMMFNRDNDPAIVNIDFPHEPWCWGELMVVDDAELASLDEAETGYMRIKTRTKAGYQTWVYAYQSAPPMGVARLDQWKGDK